MKLGQQPISLEDIPASGPVSRAGEPGPGSRLDDRFAITEVICAGGMATIFNGH